jgi:hypothetical protein
MTEQDVNGGRCKALLYHENGAVDRCAQVMLRPEDETCFYHTKVLQGLCEPCKLGEGISGEANVYRIEVMGGSKSRTFG